MGQKGRPTSASSAARNKIALPFLASCLYALGCERREIRASMRITDRNVPCRSLLSNAGFHEREPLTYVRLAASPPTIDATIYEAGALP